MAHLIDMSNGRANMAYVGEKPWHGLGSELEQGASLDQWRIAAGLNWEAASADIYYRNAFKQDANGKGELMKGESKLIYRSDTGVELGIASDRYKIVQPGEVLEFFRDLTEENGMRMETAGCIEGGKRIWALAATGDEFRLAGQDQVNGYVLLATSFDGSMATQARFTSVRVVCNNTLSVAVAGNSQGAIKVPHSTEFDGHKVKVDMGLLHGAWAEFQAGAEAMAARRVSERESVDFLIKLMATEAEQRDPESISTRKRNIIADILGRARGRGMGSQYRSAAGTAWGLLNAVTEYVDHTQGNSAETRFKSAQFGQGAQLKVAAWDAGMRLALAA